MTGADDSYGCTVCGLTATVRLEGTLEVAWGDRLVPTRFVAATCPPCLERYRVRRTQQVFLNVLCENVGLGVREYRKMQEKNPRPIAEIETWRHNGALTFAVEVSKGMATIREPRLIQ